MFPADASMVEKCDVEQGSSLAYLVIHAQVTIPMALPDLVRDPSVPKTSSPSSGQVLYVPCID
jgi:hypothetical protein